jgi:hypothetical protein
VAEETLSRAQSVHERAEHHREKCTRRLAEYATLDAEVVEHKVLALKCDVGRMDVDLPDALRRRIADRDLARTDLSTAESAAAVFLAEMAQASAAAGDAAKAVRAADAAVLGITTLMLADRHIRPRWEPSTRRSLIPVKPNATSCRQARVVAARPGHRC